MRKLDPDEAALWRRVAATIRPLKPSDTAIGLKFGEGNPAPPPVSATPFQREVGPAPGRQTKLGDSLDGGWEHRLRSGSVEPDRTLDLHGLTMDQAWTAIDQLLERSWRSGARVILLITGRERRGAERGGRGRIRAAVGDWLAASRHAPHIAAVRTAHRRHGGGGSLYIVLRRH